MRPIRPRRAGLRGAKVKVGKATAGEDAARLAAVRAAVGPDRALMVDANQSMTAAEAIRRAHAYEPYDLARFEEPLPADDLRGTSGRPRHVHPRRGRRVALQPRPASRSTWRRARRGSSRPTSPGSAASPRG